MQCTVAVDGVGVGGGDGGEGEGGSCGVMWVRFGGCIQWDLKMNV